MAFCSSLTGPLSWSLLISLSFEPGGMKPPDQCCYLSSPAHSQSVTPPAAFADDGSNQRKASSSTLARIIVGGHTWDQFLGPDLAL